MSKAIDNNTQRFLATSIKGLMQDMLEWMDARNTELRSTSQLAQASPAEAKLFAILRGRERSISDIARALGVSRQAVHHTVHRLVKHGVVEVVPAPDSKRDKLVRITGRGHEMRKTAAQNLTQIERELAGTLGPENLTVLRDLLTKHLAAVGRMPDTS